MGFYIWVIGWNWKSVNLESDFEMSLDGKLWTNFQCFILSGSIETVISLLTTNHASLNVGYPDLSFMYVIDIKRTYVNVAKSLVLKRPNAKKVKLTEALGTT